MTAMAVKRAALKLLRLRPEINEWMPVRDHAISRPKDNERYICDPLIVF